MREWCSCVCVCCAVKRAAGKFRNDIYVDDELSLERCARDYVSGQGPIFGSCTES